jgi:hypothetical protein
MVCQWYTDGGKMSFKNMEHQINMKICKSDSEGLAILTLAYGEYAMWKFFFNCAGSSWRARKCARWPRNGQPKLQKRGDISP